MHSNNNPLDPRSKSPNFRSGAYCLTTSWRFSPRVLTSPCDGAFSWRRFRLPGLNVPQGSCRANKAKGLRFGVEGSIGSCKACRTIDCLRDELGLHRCPHRRDQFPESFGPAKELRMQPDRRTLRLSLAGESKEDTSVFKAASVFCLT